MEKHDDKSQVEMDSALRVLRIIVVALVMGLSFFIGFAFVMGGGEPRELESYEWITLIAFSASSVFVSLIARPLITNTQVRSIARGQAPRDRRGNPVAGTQAGMLASAYTVGVIIGCALIEGPGFYAAYLFMATRQNLPLILAIAAAVGILLHFPGRWRFHDWIESRQRELTDHQAFDT